MVYFRPELLLKALPIMGYGMLGIFAVTGVIIGAVWVLNRLADRKQH